jgi:hypothetical protein
MIKSPVAVETITDPSKMSVSFKEVICKIAAKNILEIRRVHCRNAEVLGKPASLFLYSIHIVLLLKLFPYA